MYLHPLRGNRRQPRTSRSSLWRLVSRRASGNPAPQIDVQHDAATDRDSGGAHDDFAGMRGVLFGRERIVVAPRRAAVNADRLAVPAVLILGHSLVAALHRFVVRQAANDEEKTENYTDRGKYQKLEAAALSAHVHSSLGLIDPL
jgi:hypothetical protein